MLLMPNGIRNAPKANRYSKILVQSLCEKPSGGFDAPSSLFKSGPRSSDMKDRKRLGTTKNYVFRNRNKHSFLGPPGASRFSRHPSQSQARTRGQAATSRRPGSPNLQPAHWPSALVLYQRLGPVPYLVPLPAPASAESATTSLSTVYCAHCQSTVWSGPTILSQLGPAL